MLGSIIGTLLGGHVVGAYLRCRLCHRDFWQFGDGQAIAPRRLNPEETNRCGPRFSRHASRPTGAHFVRRVLGSSFRGRSQPAPDAPLPSWPVWLRRMFPPPRPVRTYEGSGGRLRICRSRGPAAAVLCRGGLNRGGWSYSPGWVRRLRPPPCRHVLPCSIPGLYNQPIRVAAHPSLRRCALAPHLDLAAGETFRTGDRRSLPGRSTLAGRDALSALARARRPPARG